MRSLKVASFFSGCGGLDLGFIQAGWEVVFAVDNDPSACATYGENIGPIRRADFETIEAGIVPPADCWVGGPPCQSWSCAGRKTGGRDARGALLLAFARLIAQGKPPAVVIENVKHILEFPEFLDAIRMLRAAGYQVRWMVLNSRDFGVPQNRERVLVVGMLHDCRAFRYPVGDSVSSGCVADILEEGIAEKYVLSERRRSGMRCRYIWRDTNASCVRRGPRAIDELNPQRTDGRRTPMSGRIYTTTGLAPAVCGATGNGLYLDGRGLVRRLTPRECARLQGFPDSFRIVCSDARAYRQFGNAVTVTVAKAVARNLAQAIELTSRAQVEGDQKPSTGVPVRVSGEDLRAA